MTVKHSHVYGRDKAVSCLLSFCSKLILKHCYKWFSIFSVCFSYFRWKHRRHFVCASLPVPGGVADGACGLGGVVSELRDLLQGEGDQLQGESPGRQVAKPTQLHLRPHGLHLMSKERGYIVMDSDCTARDVHFTMIAGLFYPLLIFVDVGVWGPLWWWDRLHSAGRGHTLYAVPSWGVHPCCFPRSPARTPTPPACCPHHRSDEQIYTVCQSRSY